MHRSEAIAQQPQRMSSAPASFKFSKLICALVFFIRGSSQNYVDELTKIDKVVPRNVAPSNVRQNQIPV
jgi:hypothetical protein